MSIVIRESKVVAVEGKDDISFVEVLLDHLSIRSIQVIELGGKDNFKRIIPALKNTPGFDKVSKFGIIRDADSNPNDALKSVQSALAKAGFAQPQKANEFAYGSPSVGVFIMPGNEDTGMLEDLCLQSIEDSPETACIDTFFDCVGKEKIKHLSKAKVQAYLATQPQLVNRLGLGAKKGYWNLDHNCFTEFASFLKAFS